MKHREPGRGIRQNGFLILLTIVAVALLSRRTVVSSRSIGDGDYNPRIVDDWSRYSQTGHRVGPRHAKVEIVEFVDYTCAVCGRAALGLEVLMDRYPEDIAVTLRHFPSGNRNSLMASRASECAGHFGRFHLYHQKLLSARDSTGEWDWMGMAIEVGLADYSDVFADCLRDTVSVPAIHRDTTDAKTLRISGTPAFIINDLLIEGYPGVERLERLVRDAMDNTR